VNSSSDDRNPFISQDGLTLVFDSLRPGGFSGGNPDLYIATRPTVVDPFGPAEILPEEINQFGGHGSPSLSSDGLNLFYIGGFGDRDLVVSTRASLNAPWGDPVELDENVNSPWEEEFGEFARDGKSIVFISDRSGQWQLYEAAVVPEMTTPGDFDGNGTLDAQDIDELTRQTASGANLVAYDLNQDALVNSLDINVWIKDLRHTWIGDADLNVEFNSSDLVTVLAAGSYETETNSVWSTGDFNGDGRTNSSDLVVALADGGYEQGPRTAVSAVPEPTSLVMLLVLLLPALASLRRRPVNNAAAGAARSILFRQRSGWHMCVPRLHFDDVDVP
jgi:hypothetical protein